MPHSFDMYLLENICRYSPDRLTDEAEAYLGISDAFLKFSSSSFLPSLSRAAFGLTRRTKLTPVVDSPAKGRNPFSALWFL